MIRRRALRRLVLGRAGVHRLRALIALAGVLAPGLALAQAAGSPLGIPGYQVCQASGCLKGGSVIRIDARVPPLRRYEAVVVGLQRDTVFLRAMAGGDDPAIAVPLEAVDRLDVSAGHRSPGASAAGGAFKGLLVGALVGGGVTYLTSRRSGDKWAGFVALVVGVPAGGLTGAVVGGILGWDGDGSEKWRRFREPLHVRPPPPSAPIERHDP